MEAESAATPGYTSLHCICLVSRHGDMLSGHHTQSVHDRKGHQRFDGSLGNNDRRRYHVYSGDVCHHHVLLAISMVGQAFFTGVVQEIVSRSLQDLCQALVGGLHFLFDRKFYISPWRSPFTDTTSKSLVGCIVSYLTSCPDFAASLRAGQCGGPRSVRGQLASLYTSYAVDILSDFLSESFHVPKITKY